METSCLEILHVAQNDIQKMEEKLITPALVAEWLKERKADSHKGDYGRALLVAGSKGMMGAALLSARACMRSGVGLLAVRVPSYGYDILQLGIPEAKCDCDEHALHHTDIVVPEGTEVIGIGPGLGQHAETQEALHTLLKTLSSLPHGTSRPAMVLDADALNILSQHPDWLELLPAGTILTPHPGEMKRLGMDPFQMAEKYKLVIVLKGHHTRIICANKQNPSDDNLSQHCYINTLHGNAGMAVGGSGDVLTGIILALLAQHYSPTEAACLGVWMHALAADLALQDHNSMESLLPSDIISHLGAAFNQSRSGQ